ncbi:MAG: hypothetical protein M3O30_01900 [Planctomycetota bacterium]|nr:hypothetical protein [Planctomycetota bacterium]
MKRLLALILIAQLAACSSNKPANPAPAANFGEISLEGGAPIPAGEPLVEAIPTGGQPVRDGQTADTGQPALIDARPRAVLKTNEVIHIYMYQFSLPYGSISRNQEFWKLVDEDTVDVPTYSRLLKNGIRVGRGRMKDFKNYAALIDKETSNLKITQFFNISGGGNNMVNMNPEDATRDLDQETLFVFGDHGLTGRDYAHCQNRLLFSFLREPHFPETIRVNVCPDVEVVRSRLDWWLTDSPKENPALNSEHLYDLALRADLAPDEFLVIGASPAADESHRVGNLFLTRDDPTQRVEKLLILSQKILPLQHARLIGSQATTRSIPLTPPVSK